VEAGVAALDADVELEPAHQFGGLLRQPEAPERSAQLRRGHGVGVGGRVQHGVPFADGRRPFGRSAALDPRRQQVQRQAERVLVDAATETTSEVLEWSNALVDGYQEKSQ